MRIRQIALVAADLEPVVSELCEVLDLEVGFNDPGVATFGLHNALMPIGDTFLEVVSPEKDGTTAGRLLERRDGDGGYMVILQTEDLQGTRKRLDDLGVRVVWEIELEDIATVHLHPKDVPGAILSLDQPDPPESWRWGGPDWQSHRRTGTSTTICGASVQTSDPSATAARWSEIIGRPVIDPGDGRFEIPLEDGTLRFVAAEDGRGDGVAGFDVAVRDSSKVIEAARARGLETGDDHVMVGGVRIGLIGD
jgi:hypothetical protein